MIYTLTLIFNSNISHVLMCVNEVETDEYNLNPILLNFIGGKIEQETEMHASLRELEEETGITKSMLQGEKLHYLLTDNVNEEVPGEDEYSLKSYTLWVSYGVLKEGYTLTDIVKEIGNTREHRLTAIDISDPIIRTNSIGDGNCHVYLRKALKFLTAHGWQPTQEETYMKHQKIIK